MEGRGCRPPAPQRLPSALTKLSALCKSPRIAPGLKGRPFRKLQSWSQAQCWQPRPVLGRGGRGVLCRRQMFLFSRADGARRAWRAQMGGSGEGAREAVSMSTHMVSVECDFAGRRFRFPSSAVQTLRARGTRAFPVPPAPRCCPSALSANASSGRHPLPPPVTSAQRACSF